MRLIKLHHSVSALDTSIAGEGSSSLAHLTEWSCGEMQAQSREMIATRSEMGELKGALRELKGDVFALKNEIGSLRSDLVALKGEIHETRGEVRSMTVQTKEEFGKLTSAVGMHAQRMKELHEYFPTFLESFKTAVDTSLAKMATDINTATGNAGQQSATAVTALVASTNKLSSGGRIFFLYYFTAEHDVSICRDACSEDIE